MLSQKQRVMLMRIVVAAVLTAVLALLPCVAVLPLGDICHGLLYHLVVYAIVGYDILLKSWRGIVNGRVFDENFLMAVATIGAFALALYEQSGDYLEAIAVMLFYQVGEFFQSYAVGKSRRDIAALMDIRPDYANLEAEDGTTETVDPDDVEVGQIIVVRPGEKIPIDGVVAGGRSAIDTSALTGESLPREVQGGDEVISGSICLSGVLRIRTVKEFGESTVSKILELVEDSASHKAQSETFIARFARVYTPAVCYGALALAVLPPLVRMALLGIEPLWAEWTYRALTFLVISCPCALVVSIPLSFFAGIGGASREGILVKGANILEDLSKVTIMAMDKTGTFTRGVFEVTSVRDASGAEVSSEAERQRLLDLAAHAESASSHPISRSLVSACVSPVVASRVADIREVVGQGVLAVVDGQQVAVGNHKLMVAQGVAVCGAVPVGTVVHVALCGHYEGMIVMGDVPKDHSRQAVADLHSAGVRRAVMLTGDSRAVAESVASALGVDEVFSELMPADKVAHVESLLAEGGKDEKLAFVGDGINDAPVLSRADVGIAMGALGSDAAIEAADVVLMDDDPVKIAKAIRISRRTVSIVWQNIIMALGVKGFCLVLGAVGYANMWLAIFADVGVMILAVLNAMRAMRVGRC